jgi:hypothetical protein
MALGRILMAATAAGLLLAACATKYDAASNDGADGGSGGDASFTGNPSGDASAGGDASGGGDASNGADASGGGDAATDAGPVAPLRHVYLAGLRGSTSHCQWSEPASVGAAAIFTDIRWLQPVGTRWLFVGETAAGGASNTVDRLRLVDRQTQEIRTLAWSGGAPLCAAGTNQQTTPGTIVAGLPAGAVAVGVHNGSAIVVSTATGEVGEIDPATRTYVRTVIPPGIWTPQDYPDGASAAHVYERYHIGPVNYTSVLNLATGARTAGVASVPSFHPVGVAGGLAFHGEGATGLSAWAIGASGELTAGLTYAPPSPFNEVWSFAGRGTTLFIADRWNGRVVRFDTVTHAFTSFLGPVVGTTFEEGILPAGTSSPSALALDDEGTLFVGDSGEAVLSFIPHAVAPLAGAGTVGVDCMPSAASCGATTAAACSGGTKPGSYCGYGQKCVSNACVACGPHGLACGTVGPQCAGTSGGSAAGTVCAGSLTCTAGACQ